LSATSKSSQMTNNDGRILRKKDPTTAGDFTRRSKEEDVWVLWMIINDVQTKVWTESGTFMLIELHHLSARNSDTGRA